jgi:hypothetical protein
MLFFIHLQDNAIMIRPLRMTAFVLAAISFASAGLMIPAHGEQQPPTTEAVLPATLGGTVTDVRNAMGYTYAEVDTGEETVWVAGPSTALETGDAITFPTSMPMRDFHSNSMNRDFDVLYFTNTFANASGEPIGMAGQASTPGKASSEQQAPALDGKIDKAEGGQTIADIYANSEAFKAKSIRVRGEVTKFNAGIMGTNWLHIRDGSTTDDLTVTTDSTVAVGDIVIVEGKLELDKDFGYGYSYPLIVQGATITGE